MQRKMQQQVHNYFHSRPQIAFRHLHTHTNTHNIIIIKLHYFIHYANGNWGIKYSQYSRSCKPQVAFKQHDVKKVLERVLGESKITELNTFSPRNTKWIPLIGIILNKFWLKTQLSFSPNFLNFKTQLDEIKWNTLILRVLIVLC